MKCEYLKISDKWKKLCNNCCVIFFYKTFFNAYIDFERFSSLQTIISDVQLLNR